MQEWYKLEIWMLGAASAGLLRSAALLASKDSHIVLCAGCRCTVQEKQPVTPLLAGARETVAFSTSLSDCNAACISSAVALKLISLVVSILSDV